MTELWLVRHGQTDWNIEKRLQGQQDTPLNAAGLEQAAALSVVLAEQRFSAIYSSDLSRARQTASMMAVQQGIPLHLDIRLRERNFGSWEGFTFNEVRERFPEEVVKRESNPIHYAPPGGESLAQVARRMHSIALEIAESCPAGKVLIVSHGASLASLICQARCAPLETAHQIFLENARPEIIFWPPKCQTVSE